MKQNYEVIIVGAGPAGATLAYELAGKGIGVLILEKETLPRYKCCAGGLSARAAKLLNTDLNGVIEDEIVGATITFVGDRSHHVDYDQTIMYTVMRDKFDYMLMKRAEKAGAVILQGYEVKGINLGNAEVQLSTPKGDFCSKFVVGADGARSIVAVALDIKRKPNYLVAIETEVIVGEKELARWKSQVGMDLGRVPGYGWVFPKADHLSIGIACLSSRAKTLKRHYWEFLRSLNLNNYTISRWRGGFIPRCTGKAIVSRGRAALLGDAAGLVDPLCGEGVYNTILSARLAAPVIEKSLLQNTGELQEYQKAVEKEILPEMKVAYFLSNGFVRIPSLVFEMLTRNERLWRGCCRLLLGETNYTKVGQKLNAVGGIYNFLSGDID